MRAGKGRDSLDPTFSYLRSYCLDHFSLEEETMASAGYPDLEAHRAEHAQFVAGIGEIERSYRGGTRDTQVVFALVDRLCTHLKRHLGGADRKLGRFLRGAGIDASSTLGQTARKRSW